MDHKPSHHLWAEYNMTKRFQSQSLLLSVLSPDNRFSETHNASQAKHSFVSWIQYGWSAIISDIHTEKKVK